MTANILVVTPSSRFGENVRRTLEETEAYRVHVVNNKAAAVVRAEEENCILALLDLELGEDWTLEIGQSLRTIQPSISLAILYEDEKPSTLDAIRPWVLVQKPFRVSDLLNSLGNRASEPASPPSSSSPAWLTDVSKAAQHLTRLTLESSAQAALITRKNELWAYAGGLSQSAAKEVAQTATRNWDGQKGSDLLRFIRLESTKAEHMLYATRLATDAVLALVFDAETPFSTIRSQANQLITTLGDEKTESQRAARTAQKPVAPVDADESAGEDNDLDIPPISDILNNVPVPNPQAPPASASTSKLLKRKKPVSSTLAETRQSTPLSNASIFSREASPAVPLNNLVMSDHDQVLDQTMPSQSTLDEIDVTAPSKVRKRPETPVAVPAPGEMDKTLPSPTTDAHGKIKLEPITAGLYHLAYACLLVPRFTSHYLTGDLADRVSEWMPDICVAFGWRLEFLAVRPEYLQWVVNVRPNTSPGYLMRIMRQQSSEKIFGDFPRLKKENPSGDFWAPGYLIMGGTQPHPPQLVRDYIRQTRDQQGQELSRQRQ